MTAPAKPFDLDAAVAEAEKRIADYIARVAAQRSAIQTPATRPPPR